MLLRFPASCLSIKALADFRRSAAFRVAGGELFVKRAGLRWYNTDSALQAAAVLVKGSTAVRTVAHLRFPSLLPSSGAAASFTAEKKVPIP